ncbi:MAG: hypothetical protein R6U31_05915 [bacterium]
MSYHSPRVVDPNTFQIGGGLSVSPWLNNLYGLGGEIFMKYGFSGGYDFGVHLNTHSFPAGIGLSAKKQFNPNINLIDAVNFELGGIYSFRIPILTIEDEIFAGINLLKDDFAIQIRVKKGKTILVPMLIGDGETHTYGIDEISLGIFYELKRNNNNLLFVINGAYRREIDKDNQELLYPSIGGGISYYFNIK